MGEYLKYQKMIRDLRDENHHFREEMANLRKSLKSFQAEKNQVIYFHSEFHRFLVLFLVST